MKFKATTMSASAIIVINFFICLLLVFALQINISNVIRRLPNNEEIASRRLLLC